MQTLSQLAALLETTDNQDDARVFATHDAAIDFAVRYGRRYAAIGTATRSVPGGYVIDVQRDGNPHYRVGMVRN